MLGLSKSIRYSSDFVIKGVCNSAGLLNVVHYNRVFVIAGFVIVGCHCSLWVNWARVKPNKPPACKNTFINLPVICL